MILKKGKRINIDLFQIIPQDTLETIVKCGIAFNYDLAICKSCTHYEPYFILKEKRTNHNLGEYHT